MDASPQKRRVLASLDSNAPSPGAKTQQERERAAVKQHHALPIIYQTEPYSKRSFPMAAEDLQQPRKRACHGSPQLSPCRDGNTLEARLPVILIPRTGLVLTDGPLQRDQLTALRARSASPASSSVFDSSNLDISQATTMTEPDAEAPAGLPLPPRRRIPTREESRQVGSLHFPRRHLAPKY
jgi:hypothetical protein